MISGSANSAHYCASLFTREAAVFVSLSALLAIWPVFLHLGSPFTFADSFIYLDQGDRIWKVVVAMVFDLLPATTETGAGNVSNGAARSAVAQAAQEASSIRSIPYAAFLGLLAPLGLTVAIWLQACLLMVFVYAIIAPVFSLFSVQALAGINAVMLTLTSLPFMASFLMPDPFGAVVILYAVLLVKGIDQFSLPSQIALSIIALFAITTHYGNIPLALCLIFLALLLRASRNGKLTRALVFSVGLIGLTIGGNIVIGLLAFDEFSLTPRRFPILLARSIEDGPARWYLEENCASKTYAVCDFWGDDIPNNVGDALWGERGMEDAPKEIYDRIRDEEITILWQAFQAYPSAQIWSLTGNAITQMTKFGISFARASTLQAGDNGRSYGERVAFQPLRVIQEDIRIVHAVVFVAAMLVLVFLAIKSPAKSETRQIVYLLILGLVINAAIFGGLSAPNDRYQARISWLIPFFALIFLLEYRSRQRPITPRPQ